MKMTKILALLLGLALLAGCLAGCAAGGSATDDGAADSAASDTAEDAKEYARRLSVNDSEFFPAITGVTELQPQICVVVEQDGETFFLEDDALPLAAPEAAKATLLVYMTEQKGDDGEPDGSYKCGVYYGNADASESVQIGRGVVVEKDQTVAEMLNERYAFTEGEDGLLARIADYEAKLADRDYLTAINACADAYQSANALDPGDIAEPMVYMKDANFVCEPPTGNGFYSQPAEDGQYVPAWGDGYQRPEIAGDVSLAIAGIGKRPDDSGSTDYTLEEVEAAMQAMPDSFCFSEVVDKQPFGTYSSKSTGESFTAYSYVMLVSAITMDGQLLGCRTLRFEAPDDPLGLNAQIIAMSLSVDKNGDVVFPWGYKDELWK